MNDTILNSDAEQTSAGHRNLPARFYRGLNDSRYGWVLLLVLAVLPTIFYWRIGYGGGDYLFRVNVWLGLHNAVRAGQWELGWMNAPRFGFGAPTLCFYPPAEAIVSTALSFLLPLRWVPGAIVWFALVATSICMYLTAPGFGLRRHRLGAAILLLFSANTLFVLLTRYNTAEALLVALLPLMILCFHRAMWQEDIRTAAATALLLGFGWLCDVPESIVLFYTLGAAACGIALLRRRFAPALLYCLIEGGAIAMAAFRLGPTFVEKKWVHSNGLLLYSFKELMLAQPIPARHPWIWFVNIYTLLLCAVGAVLLWRLRRTRTNMPRGLGGLLIGTAVAAVCMGLQPSTILWEHLPEFVYIQFPYRFLPFLNLAILIFLLQAGVSRRLKVVSAAVYVSLSILPVMIFLHQAPEMALPPFHAAVEQWQTRGFEGPPEYVPADVRMNPSKTFLMAHLDLTLAGRTKGCNASTLSKTPNVQVYRVDSPVPCRLLVGSFWYPYWKASLDAGRAWPVIATPDGAMQLDLPAGVHKITLRFLPRSTLRTFTSWLSLAAFLLLLVLWCRQWPGRKALPPESDRERWPGSGGVGAQRLNTDREASHAAVPN